MNLEAVVQWLEAYRELNLASAGVLSLIFTLAAFVPIPRTFLLIGAGTAFGLASLIVIVPATTFGGIAAFQLSRHLLRNWVQHKVELKPVWKAVARATDIEGWRIIALMRLWGPLPNSAQNYLFGVTNIGLLPYALITLVFSIPQLAVYVYLGASGRSILMSDESSPLRLIILTVVTIIVVTIVVLVSKRTRILLREGKARAAS